MRLHSGRFALDDAQDFQRYGELGIDLGDKVIFGKYAGTEVKLDGEEHLILREDDILGVIEK